MELSSRINSERLDSFLTVNVVGLTTSPIITLWTVESGRQLIDIVLYPYIEFGTLYTPYQFRDMRWTILVSGDELPHILIMPSTHSIKIVPEKNVIEGQTLQMQIDLSAVTFSPPAPPEPTIHFMMRRTGRLVDNRSGNMEDYEAVAPFNKGIIDNLHSDFNLLNDKIEKLCKCLERKP